MIFQNLKGDDSQLIIIKHAFKINNKLRNKKSDAIPNSYDKFMTFSLGDLKFIDSFQFMASSLEKLVENLYDPSDKFKNFTFMQQTFPEHIELLCQKGYYPYKWVNDIEKLNHKGCATKIRLLLIAQARNHKRIKNTHTHRRSIIK